eukprot:124213-Pleurochrysis_carterae.AAC.2
MNSRWLGCTLSFLCVLLSSQALGKHRSAHTFDETDVNGVFVDETQCGSVEAASGGERACLHRIENAERLLPCPVHSQELRQRTRAHCVTSWPVANVALRAPEHVNPRNTLNYNYSVKKSAAKSSLSDKPDGALVRTV